MQPDWLLITQVAGPGSAELFELQLLKIWGSRGTGLIGSMPHETLRIAKAQAHAELGVEYVEWEPCSVEITNEDGSIDWARALPEPARTHRVPTGS